MVIYVALILVILKKTGFCHTLKQAADRELKPAATAVQSRTRIEWYAIFETQRTDR